jgi:hypothetical protein
MLRFYFNDGKSFDVSGEAHWLKASNELEFQFRVIPDVASEIDGMPVFVGFPLTPDPRCLCVSLTDGSVVYSPRDRLDRMTQEVIEYLDQNPEWPFPRMQTVVDEIVANPPHPVECEAASVESQDS